MNATERTLLIRALVLGSLVLLVAGATSPLLTTERFYFFSNTISLLSGLRQLFANEQVLIAIVIGLFSLGLPVVKAVVIWIAASPRATQHALLVLADKFGKWSMLEVFVAALMLIALKLGPVVDTTLHYGAYLLAGSVLMSGLASQFVAHTSKSRPIFSSPATLTIGAVGGAVAATVLIGLMNPQLLRFEAIIGTPESRCIERTLRLDRLYAQTTATQTDYVASLGTIETDASCPKPFRDAFADYVEAWTKLEAEDANGDTEPSWLDRAGALVGLIATRGDTLEDIEKARSELERVAAEHGVKAAAQ